MCRQGEVLAWGINDFGQLGNGSTFYETSPTQVTPSVCLCACGERADHGRLFVGRESTMLIIAGTWFQHRMAPRELPALCRWWAWRGCRSRMWRPEGGTRSR